VMAADFFDHGVGSKELRSVYKCSRPLTHLRRNRCSPANQQFRLPRLGVSATT
jgi:hypothetical protein